MSRDDLWYATVAVREGCCRVLCDAYEDAGIRASAIKVVESTR